MSAAPKKTARELYDDFIKNDWPKLFMKEGGEAVVYNKGGARYVPTQWANAVLKEDHNAWDVAIEAWWDPHGPGDASTEGYDRIVEQAGVKYTWEWFLIDPSRPWAKDVPQRVRDNIKADLDRRDRNAAANVKARAAKAAADAQAEADRIEAEARAKDEEALDSLDALRREQGKPPLTAEYREQRLAELAERRKAATA